MSKLKNKLFGKFELKQSKLESIVGGAYTTASEDTNAGGGTYDVCQGTCVDGETQNDVHNTSHNWDTRDKPVQSLTNSFSQ